VPDLDDQEFETYLKQFRPLLPDALPVSEVGGASRRHFGFTIWVAGAVVAMMIVGVVGYQIINHRSTRDSNQSVIKLQPQTAPLTVQGANALLATAPSYKALMDELAFPSKRFPVPKDKQSALAVLGKEKIKL